MRPRRLCALLLLAAVVVLLPSESLALSADECAGLSIRVEGGLQALSTECGTRSIGGGGDQGSGKRDVVQVHGPDFVFVVSHASVGHRTYLVRLGVKDMIQNYSVFDAADGWGAEAESGDFTVRRFGARLAGGSDRAECFGFVHFSGHVAGTTGYRHLVSGYYCDLGGRRRRIAGSTN